MVFGSAGFFISESVKDFRNHPYLHISVVIIISLACFIFGVVFLFAFNLNRVVDSVYSDIDVTVYLKADVQPGSEIYKQLENRIKEYPAVENVVFVSAEEALSMFKKEFPDYDKLIDFSETNPLPSSIQIKLKKELNDAEHVEEIAVKISGAEGIEDVNLTGEWVNKFFSFLAFIKLISGIVIILIGMGVVFIIYNAVKITIHTRSVQIEIMKLIGATDWFIKGPFIFEGMWQGLGGTILSIGVLYGVYSFLRSNLEEAFSFIFSGMKFEFLDPVSIGYMIIGGMLLGILGGGISTAKFLKK